MTFRVLVVFLGLSGPMLAQPARPVPTASVPIHDPCIIEEAGRFYVFATGPGIASWSSTDLKQWRREKPVFSAPPAWAVKAVPGFRGAIWAPDISYHAGLYYLYYAVSAFGKNTSCIGVATNPTLDPTASGFHWTDHGKVIQSIPGVTNWNAIDPNLVETADGTPYLAYGSFWEGIKIVKLTPDRFAAAEPLNRLPTIATRAAVPNGPNPPAPPGNPPEAGGNAIEAPFVFKHGGVFYLFASIDYCCRGTKSTYKMIVGRANSPIGPFMDEAGIPLARGGGTLLLAGDSRWYGVGHNAAIHISGEDYIIFHAYDALDHGRPKMRIEKIDWTSSGWPRVK